MYYNQQQQPQQFNQQYYGNMYGANGMYGNGYVYQTGQQFPGMKVENFLTNEEIQELRNNGVNFQLGITLEEAQKAVCRHRDQFGNPAWVENDNGSSTCTICGYTFWQMENTTEQDVKDTVDRVIDYAQMIKVMYIDMSPQAGREYFQLIPLLQKLPKLYKIASDNFKKYGNMANGISQFSTSPFAVLGSIGAMGMMGGFNPYQQQPYPNMGMPQQQYNPMGAQQPYPNMGMPQQQYNPMGAQQAYPNMGMPQQPINPTNNPMGAQQPYPNMGMPQQPINPTNNPFGSFGQQPQSQQYGGYAPNQNGYQYNPQKQGQPQQQQQGNANINITNPSASQQNIASQQKDVQVNTPFKS